MERAVFIIAGACCLFGAIGVVAPRQNPVHAALSLVGSLFAMAVIFIAQGAYFLAAIQVIVYAGAIVILFLFVIMLLGVDEVDPLYVNRRWLTGAGLIAAAGVFGLTTTITFLADRVGSPSNPADAVTPDINRIGEVLFTDYLYVFEITGVLLTIAVVGAVLLSRRAMAPPWDDDTYPQPEGSSAIEPSIDDERTNAEPTDDERTDAEPTDAGQDSIEHEEVEA